MTHQIKCPACNQRLYFPELANCDEDFIEGICTKCKYKYALFSTEVVAFTSSVEAWHDNKYRKQPKYKRIYQLRLSKLDNTIKTIEFSTSGQTERISALPKDELLLLYTMRGKALDDLIWIQNYTTGRSHFLLKPGAKACSVGAGVGVLTLVASAVVAIGLHIPTNQLFFATTIPSAVGVGAYVTKRKSIKVSDHTELIRLSSEQQLLEQKFGLEQRNIDLSSELESNRRLIERLKSLRRKMLNAESQMYANRIETVSKGINILDKQINLTENLVAGYRQIVEILTIEYKTSRLSEQLPEDISANILHRLDELKLIEVKKEELALLIDPQRLLHEMR